MLRSSAHPPLSETQSTPWLQHGPPAWGRMLQHPLRCWLLRGAHVDPYPRTMLNQGGNLGCRCDP